MQCKPLVASLLAWLAKLLQWPDLCWNTTRLLLLAAREERERANLPLHSLGRLPPELLRGRILGFLQPPGLPAEACLEDGPLMMPYWTSEDGQKDVVAVLAHLLMFSHTAIWPRVSAFAFALAEDCLLLDCKCRERRVYLAWCIVVTAAQRLERFERSAQIANQGGMTSTGSKACDDLPQLLHLAALLRSTAKEDANPFKLSAFVSCRLEAALEHAQRVERCITRGGHLAQQVQ